jgi:hypothetical protein
MTHGPRGPRPFIPRRNSSGCADPPPRRSPPMLKCTQLSRVSESVGSAYGRTPQVSSKLSPDGVRRKNSFTAQRSLETTRYSRIVRIAVYAGNLSVSSSAAVLDDSTSRARERRLRGVVIPRRQPVSPVRNRATWCRFDSGTSISVEKERLALAKLGNKVGRCNPADYRIPVIQTGEDCLPFLHSHLAFQAEN